MPALAERAVIDVAEVETSLRLLTRSGHVFEVRAIKAMLRGERRRGIVTGYFKCPVTAARALQAISSASGIYVTLNVVDPSLHARAYNRLRLVEDRDPTTSDANIISRVWLLIDIDSERPANISATDAEHDAAVARAKYVLRELINRGWPDAVLIDSGNGAHVLVLCHGQKFGLV